MTLKRETTGNKPLNKTLKADTRRAFYARQLQDKTPAECIEFIETRWKSFIAEGEKLKASDAAIQKKCFEFIELLPEDAVKHWRSESIDKMSIEDLNEIYNPYGYKIYPDDEAEAEAVKIKELNEQQNGEQND